MNEPVTPHAKKSSGATIVLVLVAIVLLIAAAMFWNKAKAANTRVTETESQLTEAKTQNTQLQSQLDEAKAASAKAPTCQRTTPPRNHCDHAGSRAAGEWPSSREAPTRNEPAGRAVIWWNFGCASHSVKTDGRSRWRGC